jgi:bacteriocin-like protein
MITETTMYELTDAELNAVSGGFLDFLNDVIQTNVVGAQVGVQALVAGSNLVQTILQGNNSNI